MFLYLLSWLAFAVQIAIGTLCLGAGMYYMAEIIEEYTVIAKRLITGLLWAVTALLVGMLVFESFPLAAIGSALASHVCYLFLLQTFPYISFTSPAFILSIIFVIAHHYFSLQHFTEVWYPFSEVMAYSTLCMWILPFLFFISLSANDNVLPLTSPMTPSPSSASNDSTDHGFGLPRKKSRRNGFRALMDAAAAYLPSREKTF